MCSGSVAPVDNRGNTVVERDEAEWVAAAWARRESLRRGYECAPMLAEFDLGYVVWQRQPAGMPTAPGDFPKTVIDRATGALSTWPSVPPDIVHDHYRRQRTDAIRTADPRAELRRADRAATPTTVAHLATADGQFRAKGARGDQHLRHHPLVSAYLAGRRPTRGGDRHAELIAVSDALHEWDHRRAAAGQPPIDLASARAAFGQGRITTTRVREPGDPDGGQEARPCESCILALIHMGLMEPSMAAYAEAFDDEVEWDPRPEADMLAHADIAQTVAVAGLHSRHVPSEAAFRILARFRGLVSARSGPGEQVWIRPFTIRAFRAAHTADPLADLGRSIGTTLFPIGAEDDAVLATDPAGRVFALDQAGEWFIGPDIDTALATLLHGRAPSRIRDDGTWQTEPGAASH